MPDIVPASPVTTLVENAVPLMVAREGLPIQLCPSTIPADGAGIVRRMNAMGRSSLEMDRDGTLLIELADVLAYPREGVDDETGEVHQFSWLVLIGTSGETWGTSSPVVAAKVSQIVALWSAGLLRRPMPLQIVTRTARKSGRRYHDLILLGD